MTTTIHKYHIILLAVFFLLGIAILYLMRPSIETFSSQTRHIRYVQTYPAAIGDFIRGAIYIALYCKQHGYTFDIDYSRYAIGRYLYNQRFNEGIVTNFDKVIQLPVTTDIKEVTDFLDKNITNDVTFVSNCNPLKKFIMDSETKELIKNSFLPNDLLKEGINLTKRSLLNNETQSYSIVHLRIGDQSFDENNSNDVTYNCTEICDKIKQLVDKRPNKDDPVLILSDNIKCKQLMGAKNNYIIVPTKPKHLSIHNDDDDLKDTLIDFFLLCGSKNIIQYSIYSWGSGFSERAHDLYEVPIIREKEPGYFHMT
jgi:hypothetical protein